MEAKHSFTYFKNRFCVGIDANSSVSLFLKPNFFPLMPLHLLAETGIATAVAIIAKQG